MRAVHVLWGCLRRTKSTQRTDTSSLVAVCSARLGSRVLLLRILRRWQQAVALQAHRRAQQQAAAAWRARQLAARWVAAWRLAVRREKHIRSRVARHQQQLLAKAWHAWRDAHLQEVLVQALAAASRVARDTALLRECLVGWQLAAAACRQVELPESHPLMQQAAQLQRHRLVAAAWQAWCQHMHQDVGPRLHRVRLMAAQLMMGTMMGAFACWQQYTEQRRRSRMLKQVADLHLLSRHWRTWQQGAALVKQARLEVLRGAISHKVLLLRRAWRAWVLAQELRQERAVQEAAAAQHVRVVLLARSFASWKQWVELCREVRKHRDGRVAAAALRNWRAAVRAADSKRRADAHRSARAQLHLTAAFGGWREWVARRQLRRQRLVHAQQVLARRCAERVVGAWRRGVLAAKLGKTLEAVQELQGAVQHVREELYHRAAEVRTD